MLNVLGSIRFLVRNGVLLTWKVLSKADHVIYASGNGNSCVIGDIFESIKLNPSIVDELVPLIKSGRTVALYFDSDRNSRLNLDLETVLDITGRVQKQTDIRKIIGKGCFYFLIRTLH